MHAALTPTNESTTRPNSFTEDVCRRTNARDPRSMVHDIRRKQRHVQTRRANVPAT